MKRIKKLLTILTILITISPSLAYATAPSAPPSGNGVAPGGTPGSSSTSVSYKGKTKISSSTTKENQKYASTTADQNALLVSGGTSTLNSCTVTKSGNSDGDDSDFYGTNAAVLVYNGATLNLNKATITTNGLHANAVFAYGKGTINISDSTINTTSNNSGGVMVTGGGTLNANNLTVKTKGNSAAAIRSDRGGGDLTVTGGTYETNGQGSPAIYSTANIKVNDATLTSTSSEGVVVEGANSVELNNTTLIDTNTTLNGNSETYKNIFLYQSMSGDADQGTASFTAKDSTITTNKGDTVFVTNTTATVTLENNTITNTDGDFVRIQKGKWGNSGSNGGNVTLKLTNQKAEGNIIVDSISTLDLSLTSGSVLKTAIDTSNQAKKVNLSLSEDSVLVLTNDTYVDSLTNEVSDNSNIYLNGHKLYVNGKETTANNGTYTETTNEVNSDTETNETDNSESINNNNNLVYIVAAPIAVAVLTAVVLVTIKNKKKNN